VSTDNHVEAQAKIQGKTYNDIFKDFMPVAVKMMADDVVKAREAGRDVIWDQTSTTVKSRTKKFNMLPDYEHIAVVFATPDPEELDRRLGSRPGKNIPWNVMQGMIKHFEMPTEEEGFEEIWYV
jgi:guanylate kinase